MGKRRLAMLVVLATLAVVLCIFLLSNPQWFMRSSVNRTPSSGSQTNASQDPTALSNELLISELMTGNNKSIPDEAGEFHSWIELYNPGQSSVNLNGYALSDELTKGPRWAFPPVELAPGGHIVVFASGNDITNPNAPFLHTNFSYKAGEEAVLFSPDGSLVDYLSIPALTKEHSFGRSVNDVEEFEEYSLPTPGFANDEAGRAAYEETMMAPDTGLYINELMCSNQTTVADEDGEYSDWIELYNSTDEPISLRGFGLSDDPLARLTWRFPDVSIAPKSYLLVFASGKADPLNKRTELHATFKLSSYKESVVLSDSRGRQLDRVDYENIPAGHSYGRQSGDIDAWTVFSKPTPGFSNDDSGFEQYNEKYAMTLGPLRISEVMLANGSYAQADDKQYYDWIELYNDSGQPIQLKDYALSDNPKNPRKWTFPDVTIQPGEHMVVLASGRNITDTKKKYLETSFSLNKGGEIITLAGPDDTIIDRLNMSRLQRDMSYGRTGVQLRYYSEPTPGEANGTGYAGVTRMPAFATTPGIYDGAVEITLTAEQDETIYYTLDCTTPTTNSQRYDGAIRLDKNTVVRAVAVKDGYLTGFTASGTFLFKSDNVNHQLPVVTLVTDPKNLWDPKTGIYAYGETFDPEEAFPRESGNYYRGKGSEAEQAKWERPANFAVFGDDGLQAFSQNVDIRIAGSFGRGNAQKGFNVLARAELGESRMNYAFFDNREYTSYKSLVLRAGGQDQRLSKIRDELATGLLEDTDVNILRQAYKPYVLYLNGEYWGVYFLKEKRNRFFVAQHENLADDTAMSLIKSSSQVYVGTSAEWDKLMAYVASHDLSGKDAYAHVANEVDLESFMDYMICEIYAANSDVWNIQYYKTAGGKWKWIYYDFCWSFGNTDKGVNHPTLAIRRLGSKPCSDLFNALLKNSEWRDAFIRRFAQLLQTVYSPERVNAKVDELVAAVQPELVREREKFNASTFMGVKQAAETLAPADVDKWLSGQIQRIREFADKRPGAIREQIEAEFGLSDDYMRKVFGGS